MELSAKGRNGQLHVDDVWVTITRKGFMAKTTQGLFKGEKKIPIQEIVSVQYKKPAFGFAGYIQFTIAGGKESTGGLTAAIEDENTVAFGSNSEKFLEIKNFIEEKIAEKYTKSVEASGSNISVVEQLKQLAELRDSGIITEEEFSQQKNKILNSQ